MEQGENTTSPKVAIAVIAPGDMILVEFSISTMGLIQHAKDLDTNVICGRSSILAGAKNIAVKESLNWGADYILFLSGDITFPNDTLHRLLAHEKDIIGVTYPKPVAPYNLLGITEEQQDQKALEQSLLKMRYMPGGCMLVKTEIFKKLDPNLPHFYYDVFQDDVMGDDFVFCDRVRELGYDIWCDANLSAEIGRIGQRVYHMPEIEERRLVMEQQLLEAEREKLLPPSA
ncbi:glycosyltransferase family 2 protein [Zymomonas mobilis]|uniref:glycosyltransferase family 2 protein n=1 Tax=Zymomonas mobilis TaxID=542 RepID=UPI0003C755F3|nr:hypothetical protein [Zymomonas mobilis]AHB09970.1 hypothetical protein ZCP4_0660 [Zymomonas mobilis subsp. mobilis str. CP4 = NRRL B-14023]AHJ70275.1 hypothetical protein A254_00653 [Zymomonas mobilis subsp. mobilis NRRL B-12526]AHJ72130.1 hypothetical protein A265_00653 [Zymomonas mobilis subsp. mobilis str. CP4 = NRRL B-14023]TWE25751.1 hypothetical protein FBY52_10329 [Zymomonas mobilis]